MNNVLGDKIGGNPWTLNTNDVSLSLIMRSCNSVRCSRNGIKMVFIRVIRCREGSGWESNVLICVQNSWRTVLKGKCGLCKPAIGCPKCNVKSLTGSKLL